MQDTDRQQMQEEAQQYYNEHGSDIEPPLNGFLTPKEIRMKDKMSQIVATKAILIVSNELRDIRKLKKESEKEEKKLMQILYNHMNEHEKLITDDGEEILTWKYSADSVTFDRDGFKAVFPDMYAQFQKKVPGSRRLNFSKE